jgi:hypothetical protein
MATLGQFQNKKFHHFFHEKILNLYFTTNCVEILLNTSRFKFCHNICFFAKFDLSFKTFLIACALPVLYFGAKSVGEMRGNQMPVFAARWQHQSQICFATFI